MKQKIFLLVIAFVLLFAPLLVADSARADFRYYCPGAEPWDITPQDIDTYRPYAACVHLPLVVSP